MVKIRKAKLSDLKAVQSLNHALFKKERMDYDPTLNGKWTYGLAGTSFFKDRISKPNGCLIVAEVNGFIIGYLAGGMAKTEKYRTPSMTAELENMFVLEKFRGKGLGSKLTLEFLGWCQKNGAQIVRVVASYNNKQAIGFYKSLGFSSYNVVLEKVIN